MELTIEELRSLLQDCAMEGYKKAMNDMGVTKQWSHNIEYNPDLIKDLGGMDNYPCLNCPNNPRNGGSGICHCILGQKTIY